MYCSKCGAEYKDGALFCPKCGTRIDQAFKAQVQPSNTVSKHRHTGIIIGVCAAAALGAAALILVLFLNSSGSGSKGITNAFNDSSISSPGSGSEAGNIAASTVHRIALPKDGYAETDYYTDNTGIIKNKTALLAGLEHFYQLTGVQPYVYITNTIGDSASLEDYSKNLYDRLFTDERHFLVVFLYDKEGDKITDYKYVIGTEANAVMDKEARDIFNGYLDRYYYDSSLTYEQFFSKSFSDTAESIMSITALP